jgi:hypothetical protein
MSNIDWKAPWRSLQFAAEVPGIQRQLELEITSAHPLWKKEPQVLGRRIDCDDVLVQTNEGKFANVHLTWGSGPGAFPDEYPTTIIYDTLEQFLAQMRQDALDY